GEEITSFTAKKGINEIEFNPGKTGGFGIVSGDYILGIIEVVDNLETADLEELREKYLP
ncbi:MAG: heavy metal-associated domain protein, partial [Clostridiales bacterium]|nr:heavy metal-associated domain protein [Clostridiales bacterium]